MSVTFGKYVQKNRVARQYSAVELADVVGCHPTFIRGIERGAQNPSIRMARKILEALHITCRNVAPGTLRTSDGNHFVFASAKQGDNGQRIKTDRIAELENRIIILESIIAQLTQGE
jgi:transcriptional regulator with XRE-family HTH domain